MLEKTTRMNYLYDFYQELLTGKQRDYMSLYYLDDFSLGEIAEQFSVSRQAVYDNIKRTETILEQYEEKLHLYEKFQKRRQLLNQLAERLEGKMTDEDQLRSLQIVKELNELD